jgi:hypothetical protein
MRKLPLLVLLCALVPMSSARADEGVQASVGYSFVQYLETGGGNAPVGAFVSISGNKGLSPELDLGWQRDSEFGVTLNTFTVTAGPRFALGSSESTRPFLHVLGGLRHDRIEGESNTSWGGFAGGGLDVRVSEGLAVRLGADFQIFFDQGENLKTLRLGVGLTF